MKDQDIRDDFLPITYIRCSASSSFRVTTTFLLILLSPAGLQDATALARALETTLFISSSEAICGRITCNCWGSGVRAQLGLPSTLARNQPWTCDEV